jgi:hypothetical protein
LEDNPYRAPVFSEPPPIAPLSTLTEAEIRAFVGKRAHYYLKKWPWSLDYFGRAKGFNWAAFFFSGSWLPYRKMYKTALVFFLIAVAVTVVEEIVVVSGLLSEGAATVFDRVTNLAFPIVCGMFGNSWYLAHAKREIARIRALGHQGEDYYEELARRGGTDFVAALGFFVLAVASMYLLSLVELSLFGVNAVN